ncbi:MAG: hypothetical protein JNL57_00890 [Bacteroidetes bacterium]|nr:hypothetical protein [Bacteroidota bacterium]
MPGVGGRKWAIYAHYLQKAGIVLRVISGTPGPGDSSPWDSYVHDIDVVHIANRYPGILNSSPDTILEKIRYRLSLLWLKAITKGNYYDRGILSESALMEAMDKGLNALDTKNLIVSGGPFSLLYYGALLKERHPELNFIADIRDEWTADHFYGHGGLSKARKREEEARLSKVLQQADKIILSYHITRLAYSERYPQYAQKLIVLEHGADPDMEISARRQYRGKPVRLLNFGSLLGRQEKTMQILGRYLAQSKGDVQLEFYTREQKYKQIFRESGAYPEHVIYHSEIPSKDIFTTLKDRTAALLFLPDYMKDMRSTKFMEVIAARVPIVLVAKAGEVSRFITDHRLGVFLNADNLEEEIGKLTQLLEKMDYNESFDYSPWQLSRQAQQIEGMLK